MLYSQDLHLIPIENRHLDSTRHWANSADIQNFMLRTLPVYDENQTKWYADLVENKTKIVFAIETRQENKHIGNTGFYHIDYLHRRAEFWILIGSKSYRHKGFGVQVTSLLVNFAFNNLNLNKVYVHVTEENNAAINLYSKCNFTQEGFLRDHYFINGEYKNIVIMSLLKIDFYEKK